MERFTIPAAGKIRECENIFDCLRREIKEETGLEVVEIDGEAESTIYEFDGYKVLTIFLLAVHKTLMDIIQLWCKYLFVE